MNVFFNRFVYGCGAMLCVVWSYALCCMELCSVFHRAMFLVIWSYAPYCMELCSVSCGTMLLQLWAPLSDYPDGRLRYFSFLLLQRYKKKLDLTKVFTKIFELFFTSLGRRAVWPSISIIVGTRLRRSQPKSGKDKGLQANP